RAIGNGHFFSINPAMLRSAKGRNLIARIPQGRTLTESDGPFVEMGNRKIEPGDIRVVEEALGTIWNVGALAARSIIAQNFQALMGPLRNPSGFKEIRN